MAGKGLSEETWTEGKGSEQIWKNNVPGREISTNKNPEAELGYSTRALTNIAVFKGVDLLLRVFSISKTVPRKLLLFDDSSSFLECSVYKAFLPLADIGRKKNNLL